MRIAQIAPLWEGVPPTYYGGTERVVSVLTEELVARGHQVTLFATADSITSARLVPMVPTGLRLGGAKDGNALHVAMLAEAFEQAGQFDVIHSHVDVLGFPFARHSPTPVVHTLHGRLDYPEQHRVLACFPDLQFVSISHSQRRPVRDLPLTWLGTVYNGIRVDHVRPRLTPNSARSDRYLVFLGRISPEKGPCQAIEVARRVGIPLKVAAKIDPADREWAAEHFLPLLDGPGVEFLGEVDDRGKAELLAGAYAYLFPINWPEPFGLTMAEALACGTPVVALAGGSVEEVLVHGESGFICHSLDEMVATIGQGQVDEIDRAACRRRVEERFSAAAMADGYEAAYRRAIAGQPWRPAEEPIELPPTLAAPLSVAADGAAAGN
ncbi:MAG TPA: glycosyltransferase family 4 protein [Thermomicrobiaceae bacterium]|nr:glycosyltransferase family 4 protein [Thermomicrobiaceae bacterium]